MSVAAFVAISLLLVILAPTARTVSTELHRSVARPGKCGVPSYSYAEEYCLLESFEPTCPPNSVIVMLSSRYGRMRVGRCVSRDYYIGCSVDVISFMDRLCSGKRHCKVNIPQPDLIQAMPCPKDLVAYLDAEYQCVKVSSDNIIRELNDKTTVTSIPCYHSLQYGYHDNMLTGFIVSDHTQRTDIGSSRCPSVIVAQPGQVVNISLVDLSESQPMAIPTTPDEKWISDVDNGDECTNCMEIYAWISELDSSVGTSTTCACRTATQRSAVYSSTTHRVMVTINTALPSTTKFILIYTVIGCPDVIPDDEHRTNRHGDQLFVECTNSHLSWYLQCQDHQWVGVNGNCSNVTASALDRENYPHETDDVFTSYKKSGASLCAAVVVGVAIGIVFGISFLLAGHFFVQHRCSFGVDETGVDADVVEPTSQCSCHQPPSTLPMYARWQQCDLLASSHVLIEPTGNPSVGSPHRSGNHLGASPPSPPSDVRVHSGVNCTRNNICSFVSRQSTMPN